MRTRALDIEGAVEFTAPVFEDSRGSFSSPFQEHHFEEQTGHPLFPVRQVSRNVSAEGVLRGIHYTATPPGMAKYVFCPQGAVQDFLVDLRVGSPWFGRWLTTELGEDSHRALYIPVGVGHAFRSLTEGSMVVYLMSQGYRPENERSVDALDPEIGLPVADSVPVRSERDEAAPTLAQALERGLLPDYEKARRLEGESWR